MTKEEKDYLEIYGREKLDKIFPLGMFCYDMNCQTSRVFLNALEKNCMINARVQWKICNENCYGIKRDKYLHGKDVKKEVHIHAKNKHIKES